MSEALNPDRQSGRDQVASQRFSAPWGRTSQSAPEDKNRKSTLAFGSRLGNSSSMPDEPITPNRDGAPVKPPRGSGPRPPTMSLTPLIGTERTLAKNASVVRRVNPGRLIRFTVLVRTQKDPKNENLAMFVGRLANTPVSTRTPLTREVYAATYGLASTDIQRVRQFARKYGLRIVGRPSRGARTIDLQGSAATVNRVFGVQLVLIHEAGMVYRSYTGPISIPSDAEDLIENVLGFDNRPQASPRFVTLTRSNAVTPQTGAVAFTPVEVAGLYNFPAGAKGEGQTIAILELGGGARRRDLVQYFKSLGIPTPSIVFVPVGAGSNSPTGNPDSADGEVMLDIEVAGAVAPGAKIVVYFGANTSQGFLRVINRAVHDRKHSPSIISISWGGPENTYAAQDLVSFNGAFQAAVAMGISVFVAAGDQGSTDGAGPLANVDFPASSPNVTACGGTRLLAGAAGGLFETVWNDGASGGATGGGISAVFAIPPYQQGLSLPQSPNPGAGPGRGVPDVSGNADPVTGYKVLVDGQSMVVGGTSAVAPLWAGLFALINERLRNNVGFANSVLYSTAVASAQGFHDVTQGNNANFPGQVQVYYAGPSWDACTGLGTPNGAALLTAIQST
jgi:kumamolisin